MELTVLQRLQKSGHQEAGPNSFVSSDKKTAYQIATDARGVRPLRDVALRLATFLIRRPAISRSYVLASLTRISAARVKSEWRLIKQVIAPAISNRMNLVASVDGNVVLEPADLPVTPMIQQFIDSLRRDSTRLSKSEFQYARRGISGSPSGARWKVLEVEKILVRRWLLGEGPIAIGTLGEQVGCSYPTAMSGIKALTELGLIQRGHARSVMLGKYPRDRWTELFRQQRLGYPSVGFVDPIAGPSSVDDMLKRVNRLHPKGIALGGVAAARALDPAFDLNGTPRLDLVLHAPVKRNSAGYGSAEEIVELVRRLDPALKRQSRESRGIPILVVHPIFRRQALFLDQPPEAVPLADPVDVLWHLNELGLTSQAGQLLDHLRQKAKP